MSDPLTSDPAEIYLLTQSDVLPGKEATYKRYLQQTMPLMAKYGAKPVFSGNGVEHTHATNHYGNNAVLSFPSRERLEAFLNDPAYREVAPLLKESVTNYHTAYLKPRQSPNPETVARDAFDKFTRGLATGEWQGFLDLLTDDFVLHFPKGQFAGRHEGKEKAAEFFAFVRKAYPEGLHVTEVLNVGCSGNAVMFEFLDEGTLRGEPYRGRVVVVLEVRGQQIAAYREFFGQV